MAETKIGLRQINKPAPLWYRRLSNALIIFIIPALSAPVEVKRAAYIMFRFESANGRSGVNDNYVGAQADSGRWPEKFDSHIAGIVEKVENGTGKPRLFLAFSSWQDSVSFLVERVQDRGLFIGGFERLVTKVDVTTPEGLCIAYKRSWVTGNKKYNPKPEEMTGFLSMYRQAEKIFK